MHARELKDDRLEVEVRFRLWNPKSNHDKLVTIFLEVLGDDGMVIATTTAGPWSVEDKGHSYEESAPKITMPRSAVSLDFTYVEFSDPDYPRRYGYIQSRFVVQAVARTPIDLSVPEARQLAAPAGQVTRPSLPPPDQQVVRPRPPDTPDTSSGGGKSSASRFFVGVRFEGNGIVTDPSGGNVTSSGSGGGIVLGYGFTPHWALYGEISDAVLDDGVTNLAHVDIGTRIHFLAGPHKAVPFVQFGISGRAEAATLGGNTVTVSGAGIAFGAGVNIHFVPSFAFSTGVAWSAGDFNKLVINGRDLSGGGSVTAVSARVHVGVIWFPGAHAS
jgi:hypothetical protein